MLTVISMGAVIAARKVLTSPGPQRPAAQCGETPAVRCTDRSCSPLLLVAAGGAVARLVGADDARDQPVAHDVLLGEADDRRHPRRRAAPRARRRDRSGCRPADRPGSGRRLRTMREPSPSRVRNIFICTGVVFCASSRITKACARVRPRMKAIGATSISPLARRFANWSAGSMSFSASKIGRRYGIDLLAQIAGQKAEPLAGLDRRPRQDDPLDLAGHQADRSRRRPRDRSCRCRRGPARTPARARALP